MANSDSDADLSTDDLFYAISADLGAAVPNLFQVCSLAAVFDLEKDCR